jgi:hypothetical protein
VEQEDDVSVALVRVDSVQSQYTRIQDDPDISCGISRSIMCES